MPTFLEQQQARWKELTLLLERAERSNLRALDAEEVRRLCCLYRQVAIDLSRARTKGDDPQLIRYLNGLATRAHGQVYRTRSFNPLALVTFAWAGFPTLLRKNWKPVAITHVLFYLTALLSFLAVVNKPETAYSLFDEKNLEHENFRMEKQAKGKPGSEYKGNFTFTREESPVVAVFIIGNNIKVGCQSFAFGALFCVPALLVLVYNGLMVGTLEGVAYNHGFFGDLNVLLMTHGILELTAICIGDAAGMMIGWAMIAPGKRLRREAFKEAAREGFLLLAGACLMLIVAGTIEGFITPHYPQVTRYAIMVRVGMLMVFYFVLGGRLGTADPANPTRVSAASVVFAFLLGVAAIDILMMVFAVSFADTIGWSGYLRVILVLGLEMCAIGFAVWRSKYSTMNWNILLTLFAAYVCLVIGDILEMATKTDGYEITAFSPLIWLRLIPFMGLFGWLLYRQLLQKTPSVVEIASSPSLAVPA